MKPVYQTQFKAEVGPGAGNCWQACMASLLERGLDDVPNFMEIIDDEQRHEAERQWWESQGFALLNVNYGPEEPVPPCLHIVTGKSPRGDWLHSCVAKGGTIVHDPRPEGGGLDDVQWRTLLVPLNPVKEMVISTAVHCAWREDNNQCVKADRHDGPHGFTGSGDPYYEHS